MGVQGGEDLPQDRIYITGEKERERQELGRQCGIPVNRNLRRDLRTVCDALGIAGYEVFSKGGDVHRQTSFEHLPPNLRDGEMIRHIE